MLTCENLTLSYNYNIIFQELSFSLMPGTLLFLKGKNGSGKTSLLKLIAGLTTAGSGKIYWQQQDINSRLNDYHKELNYIGHKNALKLELTVLDNLVFWCELNDTTELLMAALAYFNLYNLADVKCRELSAGWQRRVALARLLCSPRKIWLLDEPETNLDKEGKNLLDNLINSRTNQGGIVIIASHNTDNVAAANILELEDFAKK